MRAAFFAGVCAAALVACGDGADAPAEPAADPATAAPAPRAARPEPPRAGPALREDRGGWDPEPDLLDFAARLGDPAAKAAALTELSALPRARRIDVLRAGLRLADDVAARACAARLEWRWIDGWECARCVDLLIGDVLRPGSEADFHELRSYMGSVDLVRLFAEAPPLPWEVDPTQVVGQMHRLIRPEHAALFLNLDGRLPAAIAPAVAGTMESEYFGTAFARSDRNRDLFQRLRMADDGGATPTGPGLPPLVRRWWREAAAWDPLDDEEPWEPDLWDLRWMFASEVSDEDAALLCDAIERIHPRAASRGTAILLLGKARDARSEHLLRRLADEDDLWDARLALARRGDEAMLVWAEAQATEDEDALATLMEAAPERARRFLDRVLLGEDDDAAHRLLSALQEFVPPDAEYLAAGHPDWRRTSFAGFESAALAQPLPALRLARIALVLPGCRTRRIAAAVAPRLQPADLDALALEGDDARSRLDLDAVGAFLDTGAPEPFRAALRRIAATGGDPAEKALDWLLAMGDPESAESLVAHAGTYEAGGLVLLARTKSPVVQRELERRVRAAAGSGGDDRNGELIRAVKALAVFHGFPEDARFAFDTDLAPEQIELVLAGRPVDAVVPILRALLDEADPEDRGAPGPESAYRIGAVRDPRVRDWLQEVRRRRDLDAYWFATGELAAWGDPAARAEYWKVIQDGRYRITDDAGDEFALTLGWDLAATLPHWIAELETNCCRANVAESVLKETIGLDRDGTARTDVSRARDLWDAAGGRFVRSRLLGHDGSGINGRFVPEPR